MDHDFPNRDSRAGLSTAWKEVASALIEDLTDRALGFSESYAKIVQGQNDEIAEAEADYDAAAEALWADPSKYNNMTGEHSIQARNAGLQDGLVEWRAIAESRAIGFLEGRVNHYLGQTDAAYSRFEGRAEEGIPGFQAAHNPQSEVLLKRLSECVVNMGARLTEVFQADVQHGLEIVISAQEKFDRVIDAVLRDHQEPS